MRIVFWWIFLCSVCEVLTKKKPLSILLANGLYTGHLFPLVSLGEELVRRGHAVTLVANVLNGSHTYPDFPERVGIKFVSAGFDKYWTKDSFDTFHEGLASGSFDLNRMNKLMVTSLLQGREKITELGLESFDIMVCDAGILPLAVYYHILGKKVVLFNALLATFQTSLDWPLPLTSSGQTDDLSFMERFCNVLLEPLTFYMFKGLFHSIIPESSHFREVLGVQDITAYVGTRIPMLMASAPGFDFPKSRLPMLEYVGPMPFQSPPELDGNLQKWLDDKAPRSVIYVSMGTTASLSVASTQALYKGIYLSTSYSVVWVMKEKHRNVLQGFEEYVRTKKLFLADWVAQQSLLRHDAMAISIVHCGLNTVHESILNSLPLICLPSVFDQFEVAARVVSHGVGVSMYGMLDKLFGSFSLTSQMVADAIDEVSVDNYLHKNISRMKKTLLVRGGAKRAADLVELYEDVGYDHLVPAYLKYDWNWVQYYNCDVWALLALLVGVVSWCSWRLCACACRWICFRFSKF